MISRRRFVASAASVYLAPLPFGALAPAAEGRRCEQNLRAIHDAVTAYRNSRGHLPRNLTALVIDGFIDSRLLMCPVLLGSGTNRPSQLGLRDNLKDDPMTLYIWEFPGGKSELHERQRQIGAGDWVPIVRCREHPVPGSRLNHLNLSLGGGIYRSGTDWEHQLRHIIPYPYLKAKAILGAEPLVPLIERIPPRSPAATAQQIDLVAAFNAALTDPWIEGEEGEETPDLLKLGGDQRLWKIGGQAFELRGVVQLEGRGAAAVRPARRGRDHSSEPRFPFASSVVETDVLASQLHLLCGAIRYPNRLKPEPDLVKDRVIGRVLVVDESGNEVTLDLRHGRHVVHGDALAKSEHASLVWTRQLDDPDCVGARSISHVVWPLGGERRIREIRFEASDSEYYPFLIAITAE